MVLYNTSVNFAIFYSIFSMVLEYDMNVLLILIGGRYVYSRNAYKIWKTVILNNYPVLIYMKYVLWFI